MPVLCQNERATPKDSSAKNIFGVGVQYHYGFLLKHAKELDPLGDLYPQGLELTFAWQLTSNAAYEYCSCYPKVGLSFNYFDYRSPEVLGSSQYLNLYVEPVFFIPHRFNLSFKIALVGIGYLNRPYDPESNPTNLAYSTNFAFPLALALKFNYRLNPFWNVHVASNYNHLSNGGIRSPNKGLNYPSISIGVDRTFSPVELSNNGKMRRPPPERKNRMELEMGNALKNAGPGDRSQFWVWNVNAQVARWIARSSALNAGILYENDGSRAVRIDRSEQPDSDHQRLSLQVGHEFWLGKVQFGQYIGVYVYDDLPGNDSWYHRWELDFQVFRWLYVGFGIKAHRHVADYIDLKIGYNHSW